jgi:hypothetical protein
MDDFERALTEVRPAFGADDEQFSGCNLNGIVSWDVNVDLILNTGRLMAQQVATSTRTSSCRCCARASPIRVCRGRGFFYLANMLMFYMIAFAFW